MVGNHATGLEPRAISNGLIPSSEMPNSRHRSVRPVSLIGDRQVQDRCAFGGERCSSSQVNPSSSAVPHEHCFRRQTGATGVSLLLTQTDAGSVMVMTSRLADREAEAWTLILSQPFQALHELLRRDEEVRD